MGTPLGVGCPLGVACWWSWEEEVLVLALAVNRRLGWRGRGSGAGVVCGLQLGGVPWLRNTCEEPENNWKGITYASRLC